MAGSQWRARNTEIAMPSFPAPFPSTHLPSFGASSAGEEGLDDPSNRDRLRRPELPLPVAEQILKGHRPDRMMDGPDRAVGLADPLSNLADIADGGREGDKLYVRRAVNDNLFPHGPPPHIPHVVTFVQHHIAIPLRLAAVELVSEDLCGHNHEWRHPAGADEQAGRRGEGSLWPG